MTNNLKTLLQHGTEADLRLALDALMANPDAALSALLGGNKRRRKPAAAPARKPRRGIGSY